MVLEMKSHISDSGKWTTSTFDSKLVKYGYKEEETGDTYEEGKFLITDLEKTDSAEDDSTYSASFENTGEVTTKTKAA